MLRMLIIVCISYILIIKLIFCSTILVCYMHPLQFTLCADITTLEKF